MYCKFLYYTLQISLEHKLYNISESKTKMEMENRTTVNCIFILACSNRINSQLARCEYVGAGRLCNRARIGSPTDCQFQGQLIALAAASTRPITRACTKSTYINTALLLTFCCISI